MVRWRTFRPNNVITNGTATYEEVIQPIVRPPFKRLASDRIRNHSILPLIINVPAGTQRDGKPLTVCLNVTDTLRHDAPKLFGKAIASQGSQHRDRQLGLAQALRRIVMAMVEQMILRPGDT